MSCTDQLYGVYCLFNNNKKKGAKILPIVVPLAYEECEMMLGSQALSLRISEIWFCLLGATVGIMMLQFQCV